MHGPHGNETAASWLARLADATTARQLLRLCREYIAALPASEIARLPAACQPARMDDPSDLSAYALELVRHQYDDADSPLLLRMAEFFANANVRMAFVLQHRNDSADADRLLSSMGLRSGSDRDRGGTPSGCSGSANDPASD